jgi:hypothetical protein
MLSVQVQNELDKDLQTSLKLPSYRVQVATSVLSVRALIEASVCAYLNLSRLLQSQPDAAPFLNVTEIESGVAQGKVALSTSEPVPQLQAEVKRCLAAFSSGKFQIVVDGVWHRSLDEQIELTEESQITFLRLLPLQGG